jgi:hypothetical protein
MSADKELAAIAEQMAAIKSRFVKTEKMYSAPHEDEVAFEGLVTEAKALVGEALGAMSEFRFKLAEIEASMRTNFYGGPSYNDVCTAIAVVEGAVRHLQRRQALAPRMTSAPEPPQYVDVSRIAELQRTSAAAWDASRLVQLCIELNKAYASNSHMSVAMLVRAIVDHVPPVFGCATFSAVANNYAGAKSFRFSMQNLDRSLRNIADAHLHTHIRRREALPNKTQVDFRADLDVLLAEAVRLLNGG